MTDITEIERDKLRAIQAVFEDAVKNNTIEKIEPYVDKDFSFVSFTDKSFNDFISFKEQWKITREKMVGSGSFETHLNPVPTLFFGDIAVCRGNSENTMVDKKGDKYTFSANWTVILKRNDDGWKVVRAHNSLDPFTNPMLKAGVKKILVSTAFLAFIGGGVISAIFYGFDLMDDRIVLIVYTLIVLWVFLGMIFSYTLKRANRNYAAGKIKAPSVKYFSKLSKVLFISSMLLTLLSFWYISPYMLPFFSNDLSRAAGVSLVLFGFVMLKKSFIALGNNYSPMFDAFFPGALITEGIYQRIRHPIYLYNLYVSFGLALASGLGAVLINSLIGFAFVLRAIHVEEKYLSAHFNEYSDYKKRTYSLIPFVF